MSMEIKLTDTAATNAWDSAGLGDFDPESDLADEIDADDDGCITDKEIQTYQSSKSSPTANKQSSYSVVNIDASPESFDEMKDLMNQSITSFDGMSNYVAEISSENDSISSEISSISAEIESIANSTSASTSQSSQISSKSSDVSALAEKAGTNVSNLAQVTTDMSKTSSSVDKVLSKVKDQQNEQNAIFSNKMLAGAFFGLGAGGFGVFGGIALAAANPIGGAIGIALATGFLGAGIASLFGGNSGNDTEKQKEEVATLGESAKERGDKVKTSIDQIKGAIDETEALAEKASSKAEIPDSTDPTKKKTEA